ncbi:MAG: translation initiation factor IF-2 subunit beta [Nanoarchaeota archaeon]
MDYDAMLQRAHQNMPKAVLEKERFEIPKVRGRIEGHKTVISNFPEIASTLRRPIEHILKFILKELATPGEMRRANLVFGSKIPAARINQKIREYCEEFVFCQSCGKPDTDLKLEGVITVMVCSVCGARQVVKSRI